MRRCGRDGRRWAPHSRIAAAGFTLIELMVALSIGVTLMALAAPDLIQYRRNSELSDAVNSFVAASNAAKSAALKSGLNTYITVNSAPIGWSSGWMVFLDKNSSGTFEASVDEVVLERPALSRHITSSAPNTTTLGKGYYMFNGSGFPGNTGGGTPNGTLTLATKDRTSLIIMSRVGRIRTCRANHDPDCP